MNKVLLISCILIISLILGCSSEETVVVEEQPIVLNDGLCSSNGYNTQEFFIKQDDGSIERFIELDTTSINKLIKSESLEGIKDLTCLTYLLINQRSFSSYNDQFAGKLSSLSRLTNLRKLDARVAKITGDISEISGLTNLTYLGLIGDDITGEISDLSRMTKIEEITLSSTNVSGDIIALRDLRSLRKVLLDDTSVMGDASFFKEFSELKLLSLWNSNVNQASCRSVRVTTADSIKKVDALCDSE